MRDHATITVFGRTQPGGPYASGLPVRRIADWTLPIPDSTHGAADFKAATEVMTASEPLMDSLRDTEAYDGLIVVNFGGLRTIVITLDSSRHWFREVGIVDLVHSVRAGGGTDGEVGAAIL